MKTKEFIRKTFTVLLAVAIIINFANSAIYAEALGKESVVTKTVNGVEYKIYTYVKNGINHVKVYAGDTQDYCEFYLSNKKEQLVREEYDYKGRTFFGVKDYDTNIQVIDLDNSDKVNCDVIAQGITWNKKTYEHWNNDYWYKKGNSGSKVYYQIGCVAKYRIRVDNSKKNKKTLDKYASKIKSCNKNYALALAASAGTGIGLGTVVGLVIANGAFPPSIMVDVVVAILGGGTVASLVKCTVNAYCDYKDIKDIYIDARACGSKI